MARPDALIKLLRTGRRQDDLEPMGFGGADNAMLARLRGHTGIGNVFFLDFIKWNMWI